MILIHWNPIWFNDAKREIVGLYLKTEASAYLPALERTSKLVDGFESKLFDLATLKLALNRLQQAPLNGAV